MKITVDDVYKQLSNKYNISIEEAVVLADVVGGSVVGGVESAMLHKFNRTE